MLIKLQGFNWNFSSITSIIWLIFVSTIIILSISISQDDIKFRKIKNFKIILVTISIIAYLTFIVCFENCSIICLIIEGIIGLATIFLISLTVFLICKKHIGMGDIKLFLAFALYTGKYTIYMLIVSLIVSLVYSLIKYGSNVRGKAVFMAPFICLSFIIIVFIK